MKLLYIEPFSGIAGDMFAASLLGLGADCRKFWSGIGSLPLTEKTDVSLEQVERRGIRAFRFNVEIGHGHKGSHGHHQHRTLGEIERIISGAGKLSPSVRKNAIRVFRNLAQAEAEVHGSDVKHVHFHEVGAADAIIDIVGAVLCLEILGVDKVMSAPVALGSGTVRTAHGVLPVPAPATAEILRGCPVYSGPVACELTTPTGAVLLKSFVDEWGNPPPGVISAVACGAGTKDFKMQPNVLRVSLMDCEGGKPDVKDLIGVLECNIDDMPGENFSYICPELLGMGALDYALIPVYMKKGRPGIILQVICRPEDISRFAEFILKETSSIGVRYRIEERAKLERRNAECATPWGTVGVKVALDRKGRMLRCKPEFESCARLAKSTGMGYSSVSDKIRKHISGRVGK